MDLLSKLADKYKTDKGLWHHGYTTIYNSYFEKFREMALTVLEAGIGGYAYENRGGESLLMWRDYFPNGMIYGIDIHKKSFLDSERLQTFVGSQTDKTFLRALMEKIGNPDIIIDDGSHINQDSIDTFNILFPHLQHGGYYVVEDVETSYWPIEYCGNGNVNDYSAPTVMNYFKRLTDLLNYESIPNYGGIGLEYKDMIKSIHFYKGLIFILKA